MSNILNIFIIFSLNFAIMILCSFNDLSKHEYKMARSDRINLINKIREEKRKDNFKWEELIEKSEYMTGVKAK